MPSTDSVAALVDLDRYPLLEPGTSRMATVLDRARRQLRATGAAELGDFLSAAGLERVVTDARALAPSAYRSEGFGTAYLEPGAADLPEGHPRRWVGRYAVGVIAYDELPASSPLRRLYEWEPMMSFIGAILERGPLHRYADPLGALNLAVMHDGDELQWHYDQTDFVVSLAIQDADEGGDFEVAPRIRSRDEESYENVARVLAGDSDSVVRLPMTPGTLLIFEGRYSLHRVSPIHGAVPRLVGLLAYDTRPGTCSTELLRLARYGRVG